MKTLCLIAALAVMLTAGPAAAQSTVPAAPAPTARQLELSHHLFMSMHMDQTMNGVIQPMIAQMVDAQTKQIPGFKPEWRQPLIEATQESMGELFPKLMKRMELAYAQVLTEDELQQCVAFYDSPAGQAIIRKIPAIMPLVFQGFQSDVLGVQAEVKDRFCKKIGGCPPGPADKPTGS